MAIKMNFSGATIFRPGGSYMHPAPTAPWVKHELPTESDTYRVMQDVFKALVGVRIITGFQEHMHNFYVDARLPRE
jgi:hypothetical protein